MLKTGKQTRSELGEYRHCPAANGIGHSQRPDHQQWEGLGNGRCGHASGKSECEAGIQKNDSPQVTGIKLVLQIDTKEVPV
ncbi:hypothetical protein Q31b_56610 [Novipirellula aureliae]|uniref:Uncharacterized protein n=1 Tax=Novipirellula aureliae TaxID=2527966 RepID=A0A5C6DCN1_9BACT|nr:hypothetical protein Q31b_56610 [Novipirellula aureliae]